MFFQEIPVSHPGDVVTHRSWVGHGVGLDTPLDVGWQLLGLLEIRCSPLSRILYR